MFIDPSHILALTQAVQADPILSPSEKEKIHALLSQPDFLSKLMHGMFGASLVYLLTEYLKLGKTAQILLSIAGFGVGRLLLDVHEKKKTDFANYNEKLKVYEINRH